MNYYPKIGSKVRVTRLCKEYNGKVGKVIDRDGEYVTVSLNLPQQDLKVEVYPCEIEEVLENAATKESPLPEDVDGAGGIYTKDNSDLFIERDASPKDLRMIADHIEWSNATKKGQKSKPPTDSLLWQRLEAEMPWAYDEARVVNADKETLEYILKSDKGYPTEIAEIQLARNIWKLVQILNSQRLQEDPALVSALVDAKKEHADSIGFGGEL